MTLSIKQIQKQRRPDRLDTLVIVRDVPAGITADRLGKKLNVSGTQYTLMFDCCNWEYLLIRKTNGYSRVPKYERDLPYDRVERFPLSKSIKRLLDNIKRDTVLTMTRIKDTIRFSNSIDGANITLKDVHIRQTSGSCDRSSSQLIEIGDLFE